MLVWQTFSDLKIDLDSSFSEKFGTNNSVYTVNSLLLTCARLIFTNFPAFWSCQVFIEQENSLIFFMSKSDEVFLPTGVVYFKVNETPV